jgi:large subunit ribosomal protein L9
MKIVLRDDVDNLGRKGDVVDVADGYARNYLVPRGLAIKATKGVVAQAESMRRNRAARDARERDAAEATAGTKLVGSVTAADVVDALEAQQGVVVDRRKVALDEPVKEVGDVEVEITLHSDVKATLTVAVVAAD